VKGRQEPPHGSAGHRDRGGVVSPEVIRQSAVHHLKRRRCAGRGAVVVRVDGGPARWTPDVAGKNSGIGVGVIVDCDLTDQVGRSSLL